MPRMKFAGLGTFVPERVVTNADLVKLMDTTDEWIQQRTGIQERRYVDEGVQNSDLAYEATVRAMAEAGCEATDLDLIIFATLSPEMYFPGTSVFLQTKLGVKDVPCLDIRNQCSGFLYGLSIANGMIVSGMYRRILLVGSEVHSRGLDKTTRGRDVAVIFGDGAGAVVLEATEEDTGLIDVFLGADGRFAEQLAVKGMGSRDEPFCNERQLAEGHNYPYMEGNKVFKHAIVRMPQSIKVICERNQVAIGDIDVLIAHQANLRISEAVGRSLELGDKCFNNIQKYGNTTAASIPLAMRDAIDQGVLKSGQLLALTAFGSGFTWGSALVRW